MLPRSDVMKPTKKETADQLRLRLAELALIRATLGGDSWDAKLRLMKEWRKDHPLEKDSELFKGYEGAAEQLHIAIAEHAKADVQKWGSSKPKGFIHATGIGILVDRAGYPVRIHKACHGWEYPDFDRIGMHPLEYDTSLLEHEPAPWPVPGTGWNPATDPTAKREPGKAPQHRKTKYIEGWDVDDEGRAQDLRPLNREELEVQASNAAADLVPLLKDAPGEPELPPFTEDQKYTAKRLAEGATLEQIAIEMNVSRSKTKEIKASLRDLNDQQQGLTPRKLLKMSGKKECSDAEMSSKPIVSKEIASISASHHQEITPLSRETFFLPPVDPPPAPSCGPIAGAVPSGLHELSQHNSESNPLEGTGNSNTGTLFFGVSFFWSKS
jgi:hypothetical protein